MITLAPESDHDDKTVRHAYAVKHDEQLIIISLCMKQKYSK